MWRSLASNLFNVLIVALFVGAGLVAWGQRQYTGNGPLETPICLRVEPGSNMRRVSRELADKGAISNPSIFRVGADYSGKADQLKAGSFLVPEATSMESIVDIVTRGGASTCGTEVLYRVGVTSQRIEVRELDPATNRFTTLDEFDPVEEEAVAAYGDVREEPDTRYRIAIAEGVTSWQIVQALNAAEFLNGTVEEIPAEGVLAPDSYEVPAGTDPADILDDMAVRQEQRLDEAWVQRVDGLPIETKEDALILASIIEKETGVPEERRTVASVFVNRLRQGMRLQTDPTVIYGVTRGRGSLGRGIRQSELRDDNPWNTYVIDGLPATPIANPGLASIEAALDPEDTPLLFFVADGTGGHAFAETLAEHNENVARWREIEAERANQ
ncbi:MAG: endolytic transglycosylase MltG [Pseudomonadota bacterium]